MEGPTALKNSELYLFHSGAPPEQQYVDGLAELVAAAEQRMTALGLGSFATDVTMRNPRREPRNTDNLVAAYSRALLRQGQQNAKLIALDADLIKDCGLIDFSKAYPERFVECGIAEQDMVSMACGMAHQGALPVVHSFACFLSARPNEQIYNQCSESSKVIYVGSLAGLLPGGPGHSHQCVRDISALGGVPNLLIVEPSSEAEVDALFDHLVNAATESAYLRLVSVKWPLPFAYGANAVQQGRGWVVREGTDVVIFGYGPWLLSNAWEAAEVLARDAISVRLVNLPWLNRVDPAWLKDTIGGCRTVVTLDNHYLAGGQGEMLGAAIAALGIEPAVRVTAIGVSELPECGTNDEVLGYHGLDVAGLVAQVRLALDKLRPGRVPQPA